MKNNIILLSKKQANWTHSSLFFPSLEETQENIPFETSIQDDLKILFSQNEFSSKNLNADVSTEQRAENIKDIYATYLLDDFLPVEFLQRYSLDLPAPLFITDSAHSSLDIAHFLLQNTKKMNAFLGNREAHSIAPFTSILCRKQTQGRGQLRRHWVSEEGNIYAALFLPNIPPFSTESAAPALGVLLVHALRSLGFMVELKWPNDIIQKKQGKYEKIAGILLEERHGTLIAGIGINVFKAPPSSQLREDYFMEAGVLCDNSNLLQKRNLSENSKKSNNFLKNLNTYLLKNDTNFLSNTNNSKGINIEFLQTIALWRALVEELFLCYKNHIVNQVHYQTSLTAKAQIEKQATWQELARNYLAFLGEEVRILHPIIKETHGYVLHNCDKYEYIQGRVSGINAYGELLLQTNNQIVTILGGSFSQENRA